MHGTVLFTHVDQVPVSYALNPGDMLAMDDLPPPAPCHVVQLFDLTIDEFSGHHDVSGGRHPPISEFPLAADRAPVAADGGEVSRPEGPCQHHEHLIAILDRTPAYSCRPMSSYVVAFDQFL